MQTEPAYHRLWRAQSAYRLMTTRAVFEKGFSWNPVTQLFCWADERTGKTVYLNSNGSYAGKGGARS